jgi:hypothetical protein
VLAAQPQRKNAWIKPQSRGNLYFSTHLKDSSSSLDTVGIACEREQVLAHVEHPSMSLEADVARQLLGV